MKAAAPAPKAAEAQIKKTDAVRRIDLVERRMFGLLDLMKKSSHPKAAEYEAEIRKMGGTTEVPEDAAFEAEALFGPQPDKWDLHMRDLISNFEEDIVCGELIKTMNELRQKEKAHDQAAVAELAKKCQVLSIRKAEIAKLRR